MGLLYIFQKTHTSVNKAEFADVYEAGRSAIYYTDLIEFARFCVTKLVKIDCDNQGAADLSTKSVKYDSRDFDATNLKVVDWASEGKIAFLKVDTALNPADLLIKPLHGETHRKHLFARDLVNYDESYAEPKESK